jgi:hypothetical protein
MSEGVFERANHRCGPFAHWCLVVYDTVCLSSNSEVHQ